MLLKYLSKFFHFAYGFLCHNNKKTIKFLYGVRAFFYYPHITDDIGEADENEEN